jgi:hypothetical protein
LPPRAPATHRRRRVFRAEVGAGEVRVDVVRQSSSDIPSAPNPCMSPALLTRISRAPWRATMAATTPSTAVSSHVQRVNRVLPQFLGDSGILLRVAPGDRDHCSGGPQTECDRPPEAAVTAHDESFPPREGEEIVRHRRAPSSPERAIRSTRQVARQATANGTAAPARERGDGC